MALDMRRVTSCGKQATLLPDPPRFSELPRHHLLINLAREKCRSSHEYAGFRHSSVRFCLSSRDRRTPCLSYLLVSCEKAADAPCHESQAGPLLTVRVYHPWPRRAGFPAKKTPLGSSSEMGRAVCVFSSRARRKHSECRVGSQPVCS